MGGRRGQPPPLAVVWPAPFASIASDLMETTVVYNDGVDELGRPSLGGCGMNSEEIVSGRSSLSGYRICKQEIASDRLGLEGYGTNMEETISGTEEPSESLPRPMPEPESCFSSSGDGGVMVRLPNFAGSLVSSSLSVARLAAKKAPALCAQHGPEIALKVMCLSVLHQANPKRASQFEFLSVVVPPAVSIVSRLRDGAIPCFPGPLQLVMNGLSAFTIPVCLVWGARFLFKVITRGKKRCARDLQEGEHLIRTRDILLEDSGQVSIIRSSVEDQNPQTAAQYAEIYKPILEHLKAMVNWEQIRQCPRFALRFDDSNAELMRYAGSCGLLEAKSKEDVEYILQCTLGRIEATLLWTQTFPFCTPKEFRGNVDHLVKWTGRTPSGHPVLLVKLGQAVTECEGLKAKQFSEAVVSQVDRGVRKLLDNGRVDQLITIVDCSGAGLFQVLKLRSLMKGIPTALNKHYPGRLKQAYIIHISPPMRLILEFVKPFLHPKTKEKLQDFGADISSLPEVLQNMARGSQEKNRRGPHLSSSHTRGIESQRISKAGKFGTTDGKDCTAENRDSTSQGWSEVLLYVLLCCIITYSMLQWIAWPPEDVETPADDL